MLKVFFVAFLWKQKQLDKIAFEEFERVKKDIKRTWFCIAETSIASICNLIARYVKNKEIFFMNCTEVEMGYIIK